jgi:hypothetical protein
VLVAHRALSSSILNVADFQTGNVAAGIDLGKAIAKSGIAACAYNMARFVFSATRVHAPSSLGNFYNTDVDLLLAVSDVALQYATVNEKVVLWAMNMVTGKAEPNMTIVVKAWVDHGEQVLFFVPYHSFFGRPWPASNKLLAAFVSFFVLCRSMTPSPSSL